MQRGNGGLSQADEWFFQELLYGIFSDSLQLLTVDFLVEFWDIVSLPSHPGTSPEVSYVMIKYKPSVNLNARGMTFKVVYGLHILRT
jgi:hypothetical protein